MTDPSYMLDTSALLAVMLGEDGSAEIIGELAAASVDSVSLMAAVTSLRSRGLPVGVIESSFAELQIPVIAFERSMAFTAASKAWPSELPIEARACLAAAKSVGAVVLTVDQSWGPLADAGAVHLVGPALET